MNLSLDAAQLEWRVAANNSQDKVAIQEITEGLDGHSDNQHKFDLPSRLIAKVFLFRTIFCPYSMADRTAYAFSVDNDFKHVGGVKFWRGAIEQFYDKYAGLREYHVKLVREATTTGVITSESGRTYKFEPKLVRGEMTWPISDIVNYPVQGFSADLMTLARVSAWNKLKDEREKGTVLFENTIHDSLKLDVNMSLAEAIEVGKKIRQSFQDIPKNCKKIYGKDFLVPMDCDFKVGINNLWQHKVNLGK